MPRIVVAIAFLVCCFQPLAGCAKHEYVIIQPPESAGRLTKQERTIDWEPVIYHFVDQSSRVGIRIENPNSFPLIIKGEDSYIVTPDGQSSSLRGGTIAPMTWTGITIPALVRVYGGGGGMSFGLGVGSWGSSGGGGVGVGYSPWYDGYYAPRDEVEWRWKDGSVRMHLVIENADDPSQRAVQEFTIERRKVE